MSYDAKLARLIRKDPFHAGLAKHGSFDGFYAHVRDEPPGPKYRPMTDLEIVRSQRRIGNRCEDKCVPSA